MPRGGCAGAALAATLAWSCAAVCGLVPVRATAATPPATVAEARIEFDIPSQPLAAALNAWAVQANTQVFVDPGPVAHLVAPAIKGALTPRQALHALLARSRLQVSQGADGVFVIKPRPAAVATQRTPAPQNAAPESPAPAAIADEPLTARASGGPWLLGVSVDYEPDNGHANGGATAAIAAEYFFTDYFAAAVALTVPRTYSLAGGHGRLQSSAMTLKYYFAPEGRWDPYLGAGADVTALYDASGSTARDRVISGPVAEAGVNLRLDRHWMLNADLSWAQDPLRFGLGFVYRF